MNKAKIKRGDILHKTKVCSPVYQACGKRLFYSLHCLADISASLV